MLSSSHLSKMVSILYESHGLCKKQNWHLLSEHTLLKLAWGTLASVDLRGYWCTSTAPNDVTYAARALRHTEHHRGETVR